jgi:hypothetical protein
VIISTGARKSIQLSDQVFFPGFLSLQFGEKGIHLFAFNRVDQVLLVIDSTFMPDMQDLRITTGVEGIGLTTRWERISKQVAFRRVFRCYRKALIVEHKEPKELETGVYLLTRVGRELLDLGL